MIPNSCDPERTGLFKIYSNGYPQKLWILLGTKGLKNIWDCYF